MIAAFLGGFFMGAFVGILTLLFIQGVGTLSHRDDDERDINES